MRQWGNIGESNNISYGGVRESLIQAFLKDNSVYLD